jgi:hypothetical protein
MDTTASPNARRDRRDRITVDLRGLGLPLHQLSAARGTTVAALTRGTLAALLEAHAPESTPALVTEDPTYGGRTVKTTLRIPVTQALILSRRARASNVSQGIYVAGLIDNHVPPPVPVDYKQAVVALSFSTDQLAALCTDLNAFIRLLTRGSSNELEKYRATIRSLAHEVRRHLKADAALLAQLKARDHW